MRVLQDYKMDAKARRLGATELVPSWRAGKKFAVLYDGKYVHFGAAGYEDFRTHRDPVRRESYRRRHEGILLKDGRRAYMSRHNPRSGLIDFYGESLRRLLAGAFAAAFFRGLAGLSLIKNFRLYEYASTCTMRYPVRGILVVSRRDCEASITTGENMGALIFFSSGGNISAGQPVSRSIPRGA